MVKKNIGSSFDDFLQEESMLEEATAVAIKRVIAWQIAEEMKTQSLTKTQLASKMHTSRAALNRLLDEEDTSLTLTTLASAAAALGTTIKLELQAASRLPRVASKGQVTPHNLLQRPGVPDRVGFNCSSRDLI